MKDYKKEYINYRIRRAKESFRVAQILFKEDSFNSSVNRLYYSAFYIISALLLKFGYSSSKHTGVRALFIQHFIKKELIPKKYGKLYNLLFDFRSESDYSDLFYAEKKQVEELIPQAKELIDFI